MNELFINASRAKYRFDSVKGSLLVEDLWDLPLTGKGANLDDIAVALHKQVKDSEGNVSFVKPITKKSGDLQAKFDIVKYVIDVKVAERDAAALAADKADRKQKLLAKLAEKQDKDLDNKSAEEIQAMVDAL